MQTAVTAQWLLTGETPEPVPGPVLLIEDGHVVDFWPLGERGIPESASRLDFPGATLAPAFVDVHIHGAAGHDVMEATPRSLQAVGGFLAKHGTGSFLATTVTAPLETTLRSLEELSRQIEAARSENWPGARPLGIHLEGPFLSHAKRGVHPPEHLLAPDTTIFDRLYAAAEGHIRLMTLAPELAGAAELTAHATALGVRVSVGHSNATAGETLRAIAAGATSATHTFNAMRPLDHRQPGILGAALTTDSLFAELICDGIHVDPALVRLWWRAKGAHRAILVTDAMAATGMGDGEYRLGELEVEVAGTRCTLKGSNGVLAGSVLTLDRALGNLLAWTGASVAEALPALTRNPAEMTGFSRVCGEIRVGGPADLVALSETGSLAASIVRGRLQEDP